MAGFSPLTDWRSEDERYPCTFGIGCFHFGARLVLSVMRSEEDNGGRVSTRSTFYIFCFFNLKSEYRNVMIVKHFYHFVTGYTEIRFFLVWHYIT